MAISLGLIVILVLIVATSILFIRQKNIIYRIQLSFAFNTLIIIFIALWCYKINKPEYIDLALLYAVLSYVFIVAISKFLTYQLEKQEED